MTSLLMRNYVKLLLQIFKHFYTGCGLIVITHVTETPCRIL